jgi:hypothetical protein
LQWHPQLTYEQMQVYAKAVEAISDCPWIWGFVDGTFRGFCRLGESNEAQRQAYSGHKRQHGQNFQAIVTPDGLVSSLTGPFFGPTNDWTMWKQSNCQTTLRAIMEGREIQYLYGNPAYNCVYGVISPYTHPRGRHYLLAAQQSFNKGLSTAQIAVENAFRQTQQLWTYTAFSKGLKAGLQPVAAHFAVAILLLNCHTCMHGNSISGRFLVPLPLVEAYLNHDI